MPKIFVHNKNKDFSGISVVEQLKVHGSKDRVELFANSYLVHIEKDCQLPIHLMSVQFFKIHQAYYLPKDLQYEM